VFHGFQAAGDLRLLRGEALDRKCRLRLDTQPVANAQDPPVEFPEAGAARRAAVEVRMAAPGRPQARKLAIVEMTAAEAFKK
jgi:hypothetical protein